MTSPGESSSLISGVQAKGKHGALNKTSLQQIAAEMQQKVVEIVMSWGEAINPEGRQTLQGDHQ